MNQSKLIQFINETIHYYLNESVDELLPTLFSLIKYNNGEFKSDKQKKFLLNQRNDGDTIRIGQTFTFGEHGGARNSIEYTFILDDLGINKVIKTSKKGTKHDIWWERSAGTKTQSEENHINKLFNNEVKKEREFEYQKYLQAEESVVKKISAVLLSFKINTLDDILQSYAIYNNDYRFISWDINRFMKENNNFNRSDPKNKLAAIMYDTIIQFMKENPKEIRSNGYPSKFYDVNDKLLSQYQTMDGKKKYLQIIGVI
jgi:hypothetical protein